MLSRWKAGSGSIISNQWTWNLEGVILMNSFAIIEVADGLTIIEIQPGERPEDVAISRGGVLVDAGPYATMEEVNDALANLEGEVEEETY
jgi:hypothetical protein